jgi:competence transcription factor ComK
VGEKVMKAGRELDALIAEKVMGWKRKTIKLVNMVEEQDVLIDPRLKTYSQPPHYSTNIADAWLVVEKFPQIDICMSKVDDKWNCFIEFADHMAIAETAPLAICLAALKACGVEVEG